jgi:2-oxoglutarate ferredoxin oxidoreductase subunit beta
MVNLRKLEANWDPQDRFSAINAVQASRAKGEILTGLLYIQPESSELHEILNTADKPLNALSQSEVCPSPASLAQINASFR